MKPILWVRHIKILTGSGSVQPAGDGEGAPNGPRLSLADKAAFAVLAVGLLALGGVIFAAGLALLLALAAGGLAVGAFAVARHRLFGPSAPRLAPGEIPATAVVLPSASPTSSVRVATPPPELPPARPGTAPRAD
jgi:hypothetical protein